MIDKIATKIIIKYLKKGNMSRCLRDILPSSGLTMQQRDDVAEIVHDVIRWKKIYDYIIKEKNLEKISETYVNLAIIKAQTEVKSLPFDYKHSCSKYLAKILKKQESLAEYLNQRPPTTLCANLNTINLEGIINILENEKLPATKSKLETSIKTNSIGRYSSVVKDKYAHIQDENSQLIAYITVELGEKILDYCAGNGGKSLSMASITKNRKKLHSYEINTKRKITLEKRCKEYDAKVIIEDNLSQKTFDVILVDAPCTGIGAARRNPEAKYVQSSGEFPDIQIKILKEASEKIIAGGYLVYTVCTITPEETEEVIKKFLEKSDFKLYNLKNLDHSKYIRINRYGGYTEIPDGDLFFISVLKKET